jgi:YegS/Rv2252/BmrU family lipid kinase
VSRAERDVALLCNPSAGGGRAARVLPQFEEALRSLGVAFHTETTRDLDHGRDLAATAARTGEVVVTLGGDGLVGCAAGALRGVPGSLLGLLPGGRGNDFARVLGVPLDDIRAACAVLRDGVERDLDLGEADGKTFVGIASFGFDSEANRIANEAPARLGGLVYAYGALGALAAFRPARFEVTVDDEAPVSFLGYSVGACNSKAYGGGMYAAPDAELDDGMLDVVVCEWMPKPRFLTVMLPRIFKGTHVRLPEVHVLRGREVRVHSEPSFTIYADGDPIASTPATLRATPGAVRVVCPA